MSETAENSTPQIFTSLFSCEKVIREYNDLLTAVRIASAFDITPVALSPRQPDGTEDQERMLLALPPLKFFVVVIFMSGQPVEFIAELRTLAPSGKVLTNDSHKTIPLKIQRSHFYQVLNLELTLKDQESGLYWLQVYVNGNLANQIAMHVTRHMPNSESATQEEPETTPEKQPPQH